MDYFREKYQKGAIDTEKYVKVLAVLDFLKQGNCNFVEMLGEGSYGWVLKVKHLKTHDEFAAKIVSEGFVSQGETTLWPTVHHPNLLPLISCDYVYLAHSYLFYTAVHPTNLEKEISEVSFLKDEHAFSRATHWLKNILAAVAHLHNKNLSHLDIKLNNVLISEDKEAILTDFGFLTSSENRVKKYGAPLLYRCPEGWMNELGFPEVDGEKFDVWSLGTLAFELFTKETLLFEISNINCQLHSWHQQIYPIIKVNLQKEKFTRLMRRAFPASSEIDERVDDVINFIRSCLVIVPEKRPSIRMLQEHELFGGTFKNIQLDDPEDIWCNRTDVPEFDSETKPDSLNVNKKYFRNECQYNSTYIVTSNREKFDLKVKNYNETYVIGNNAEKNDTNISHYNSTYTACSEEEKKMLNGKTDLITSSEKYEHSKDEPSDEKSNFDIELHSLQVNQLQELSTNCTPSTNVSDQVTNNNILEMKSEKNSSSNKSECVTEIISQPTRCQKFRKWCRKRKNSLVRIFTACVPCARRSATDEE